MEKLPYISEDLPGIGGSIRGKPGYFIVEEIPLYIPSGEGDHLYVNVRKEGITTLDVHSKLCELLGKRPEEIGYAGLKDKHARTFQTFSIYDRMKKLDSRIKSIAEQIKGVRVYHVTRHTNKIRVGHLKGNKFIIKISGVDDDAQYTAKMIAEHLIKSGVPNYYGPQRFGINQDNHIRGREIVMGKSDISRRWRKRFLVSAYQSHLCNRYLASRIRMGLLKNMLEGDIAKKYETGGLFDVKDIANDQYRYDSHEISFTAPIYGSKMRQASGPAGELENAVLENEGITLEQLGKAGAKGTRRLGRILVKDIRVRPLKNGLRLSFTLPKGAFATTVLREFMKND
jgi:tRNA pseudouridine13 synthase